jgi:hypothetical protein
VIAGEPASAACHDCAAMRTVIVSDLHLGAGTDVDLLRAPALRDVLMEEITGADRLILLGDVVELRERPLAESFDLAEPFFSALAEAVPDTELVIVPGNHDHHVLEDWLARRRLDRVAPLALEQRAPDDCEGPLVALAKRAGNPSVGLSYPGLWVREDIYATHGHYLDRHLTIPTFERLALAAVERALGPPSSEAEDPLDAPEGPTDPDEYERALTPVYAFLFALAQGVSADRRGPGPSARIWAAMSEGATRAQKLRGWLLGSVALPGAVGMANRFGLGPVKPDLSPGAITRAGITAMGEVIERLGIDAEHVIFGHTHRRGPLDGEPGWTATSGAKLLNSGSWTHMPGLIGNATPDESPYWPGTIVEVTETGPPVAKLLLGSLTRTELTEAADGSE